MSTLEIKEVGGNIRETELTNPDRREVTIIQAGWGSSGYYSEDMLGRDGPTAFPQGTHMYLNHPTLTEERERPERDVRDLAATLVSTPRMAGIDLIAEAEIKPHMRELVNSVATDIGLSIRAIGEAEAGAAGGREGPIISALNEGISVDFVTQAGAGGKIGQLIESAHAKFGDTDVLLWESMAELLAVEAAYEKALEPDFSRDGRVTLAKKGQAIPVRDASGAIINGRFPIATEADVRLAAECVGENAQLKSFIQRAATHIGCPAPFQPSAASPAATTKEDAMSDEDKKRLSELEESVRQHEPEVEKIEGERDTAVEERDAEKTRADRAEDALRIVEADKIAKAVISKVEGLPERAQKRACEAALRDIPVDDGKIDKDKLKERAKKAAEEERDYLAGKTGEGSTLVEGMGSTVNGGSPSVTESASKEDTEALIETFKRQGMSDEAAKIAAEGR